MASAIIDLRTANRRELPPVCVVSGAPADGIQPVTFTHNSATLWMMLAFGWFAAMFIGERQVLLPLPFQEAAWRELRRRWTKITIGGVVAVLVGVAIMWTQPEGTIRIFVVGLAAVLGGITAIFYARSRPGLPTIGRPTDDGYVELRSVHPAFAAALAAQQRAS